MIGDPINDVECLSKITDVTAAAVNGESAVRNLAGRFATPRELAMWIRSLPQRNDTGNLADGPRVSCDVSQRLRFGAADPNCVERSATYLAVGELVDPGGYRQLATIDTPLGRHTFPVEDGQPVNLDPRIGRNALAAGLFRMDPEPMDEWSAADTLGWIAEIAREPAVAHRNGVARVRNAASAFDAVLEGDELPRNGVADMAFALGVAEQAGRLFGVQGMDTVQLGRLAVLQMLRHRNGPHRDLRIGGLKIPKVLTSVGKVVGRIGEKVGGAVIRAKMVSLGIPPQVVRELEKELNREGLSLGAVTKPLPQLGTWDALTNEALILRRIQNWAR